MAKRSVIVRGDSLLVAVWQANDFEKRDMMRALGKFLQIAGLIILPLAIYLEIMGELGRNGVAEMLIMLVAGAAAFMLGRLIEGYGG